MRGRSTILIAGPPGAGKTALLWALSDELVRRGCTHGHVELDGLNQAHPPLPNAVGLANLETVVGRYREHGRDLIVITATPETPEEMDEVLGAVGSDALTVWLDAPPAVLRRRLIEREPEDWAERLIAVGERLRAKRDDIVEASDLTLDTDALSPREAVAEVLAQKPVRDLLQ